MTNHPYPLLRKEGTKVTPLKGFHASSATPSELEYLNALQVGSRQADPTKGCVHRA